MLRGKIFAYLFAVLFLASLTNAATIHGTIYDLSLNKAINSRVEVNTLPKQFLIAQNGSYSFDVPNGLYKIKAQMIQKNTLVASVEENITIRQEGDYVLDLILFPDIEKGVENPDIEIISNVIETKSSSHNYIILFVLFSILIIAGISCYFIYLKKKKIGKNLQENSEQKESDEDNELQNLILLIKKEDGRITQKEIRKQIPLSEAKISLMITELEHKGIIEKIKKGRGNIIILKKK